MLPESIMTKGGVEVAEPACFAEQHEHALLLKYSNVSRVFAIRQTHGWHNLPERLEHA